MNTIQAFILCKNEAPNIGKCLHALKECNVEAIVLDSGSTDDSLRICEDYDVKVYPYKYKGHCAAYNEITSELCITDACVIIDADMIVNPQLVEEVKYLLVRSEVILSPVTMVYEGQPLRHASLYPPKAIAFRKGKSYFVPSGHGERLVETSSLSFTTAKITHDDRKPYSRYIESQLRYANEFVKRKRDGQLSFRDSVRARTPVGIILIPFISMFIRFGILDSKRGVLYALDRLIAEAMMYRYSLADELNKIP